MNIKVEKLEGLEEKPSAFTHSFIGGKSLFCINTSIVSDGETYSCTSLHVKSEARIDFVGLLNIIDAELKLDETDIETLRALVDMFKINDYDSLVPLLINARYSLTDELSCHRKALLGDEESLTELNDFVSYCKGIALQIFNKN